MGAILTLSNVLLSMIIGSLGISCWFFRRWMKDREIAEKKLTTKIDNLEKSHIESISAVAKVATDAATAVALVSRENRDENVRLTNEIKMGINDNKSEYTRTGIEIKLSIDSLSKHVQTTNGRVTGLELKNAVQEAIDKKIEDGTLCKTKKIKR